MTLEIPGQHGPGIRDLGVINELQGLTVTVAPGALPVTNIPITGINVTDTLLSVIASPATGIPVDRTAQVTITSAGNIQLSTTDTTGQALTVMWFDKDPDD